MNHINEYNIKPGTYQHYKGTIYVVTDVVTHMDNTTTGNMEPLPDPLVVYRDLTPIVKHINGRAQAAHQVYARPCSEFNAVVIHNEKTIKRFTSI